MPLTVINPDSLGRPRGYSNGIVAISGKMLFISGQVGWDEHQQITSDDIVEQFDVALANLLKVVDAAGGSPTQIARMMIYVTDIDEYRRRTREIGERYRAHMGKHFPAMVLVEVKSLLEDRAKVEIEGQAVLED